MHSTLTFHHNHHETIIYIIQEPMEAVKTLEVFSADGRADAGIALYLLVDILNRFNSSDALTRENFSQVRGDNTAQFYIIL